MCHSSSLIIFIPSIFAGGSPCLTKFSGFLQCLLFEISVTHNILQLCGAQRAKERKTLKLKLNEIRKRTKMVDIIEFTLKQTWK